MHYAIYEYYVIRVIKLLCIISIDNNYKYHWILHFIINDTF